MHPVTFRFLKGPNPRDTGETSGGVGEVGLSQALGTQSPLQLISDFPSESQCSFIFMSSFSECREFPFLSIGYFILCMIMSRAPVH